MVIVTIIKRVPELLFVNFIIKQKKHYSDPGQVYKVCQRISRLFKSQMQNSFTTPRIVSVGYLFIYPAHLEFVNNYIQLIKYKLVHSIEVKLI